MSTGLRGRAVVAGPATLAGDERRSTECDRRRRRPDAPWPVAVLAGKLKGYIDRLGTVWVEGEITQWGVSRRQRLRQAQRPRRRTSRSRSRCGRRCARASPSEFKQGDRVIALRQARLLGQGRHRSRCRSSSCGTSASATCSSGSSGCARQLAAEGLFDPTRKQPLPFLPGVHRPHHRQGPRRREGRAAQRPAALAVRASSGCVHAAVQGDRAAPEVSRRDPRLDADPEVDVIIVARGGGDFQNLLGFSDERLVRTAAACVDPARVARSATRPTGPLLDEVADLRASTPTDAAKRVVPDVAEELVPRRSRPAPASRMRLQRRSRPRDRPPRAPALAAGARRTARGSSTAGPRSSRAGSLAASELVERSHRARRSRASPNCAGTCARSRRSARSIAATRSCSCADGHVAARRRPGARGHPRHARARRRHDRGRESAGRRRATALVGSAE